MKKRVKLSVLFYLAVFWSFGTATHLMAEEFPVIGAAEVKAKLDKGEKVLLINPLSDIEFNEGFIPGSINIPLHDLETTDKLPENKDALIITYCMGPK